MNNNLKKFPRRASVPITAAFTAALMSTSLSASPDANDQNGAEGELNSDSHAQVIVPMLFRDGATHKRVLDNVDGLAMTEGDIIIGKTQHFFSKGKDRSIRGLSNYVYGTVWPNGLVPYRISEQLSGSAKLKVQSAIEQWNQTGAVTLVERTDATAGAFPNFIDFVEANQCASWVGFQNSGAQSIYTGDKCSEGSMIHEIGHALGLLHEHTRPDRDNFVQINWNSIQVDKAHNFDVLADAIPLGSYDYESIMHYGTHFFSKDGAETITALQNTGVTIGQREYISAGDRNSITELYKSEFSVVSSSPANAVSGNTMQLDLIVTNNSDMGANGMRLTTTVPAELKLESFSSPSWVCQQQNAGEDVVCLSSVLAERTSSSVSVNLSTPNSQGVVSFDTTLAAKTHDTDLSNNQDKTTTLIAASDDAVDLEKAPAPVLAAATAAGGNGGGGSLSFMIFILLPFVRRRNH